MVGDDADREGNFLISPFVPGGPTWGNSMSEDPPSPNPAPRPKPRLRLDTATPEPPRAPEPEPVVPEPAPAPPPPPPPAPELPAAEPVKLKLKEAGSPQPVVRPTLPPFSAIAKEPLPEEAASAGPVEPAPGPDVDTTISTPESRRRRWLLLVVLTLLAGGLWLWLQDRTKRDQSLIFPPGSAAPAASSVARPVESTPPAVPEPGPGLPPTVPEGPAEQPAARVPVAPAEPLPTMARVSPVLAASAAIEAQAGASAGFRSFVANARVTGVFQGTPGRAMINGKLRRGGETVDLELGIVFVGVDVEARQLTFVDRTGAKVIRGY